MLAYSPAASKALEVTAQWSAASTNYSFAVSHATLELV